VPTRPSCSQRDADRSIPVDRLPGLPKPPELIAQVEDHSPVKAVEFIQAQHLPAPMLNDWTMADNLIWPPLNIPSSSMAGPMSMSGPESSTSSGKWRPSKPAHHFAGQVPHQLLPAGTQLSHGHVLRYASTGRQPNRRQSVIFGPDATGQPSPLTGGCKSATANLCAKQWQRGTHLA